MIRYYVDSSGSLKIRKLGEECTEDFIRVEDIRNRLEGIFQKGKTYISIEDEVNGLMNDLEAR